MIISITVERDYTCCYKRKTFPGLAVILMCNSLRPPTNQTSQSNILYAMKTL